MKKIKILDCTLRDGGYVNDFEFEEKNIKKIVNSLAHANIDFIECGFLKNSNYDSNKSIFSYENQIEKFIPKSKNKNTNYVAMIAINEFDVNKLSPCNANSINGIRLTFHKNQIEDAILQSKIIISKGYKLFFQPVGITSYSDKELINLIEKTNLLNPYAFYIVDTLGVLNKKSITHIFNLIDKNLNKNIYIGYHSHNNLQLAFSNAQELCYVNTERTLILDSSVYGMGRGAGNLCTELIAEFLNDISKDKYEIVDFLELIDNIISKIYEKTPWGYNYSYYLAAKYACHPSYATYLLNKQTLTAYDMDKILSTIKHEKRDIFDKIYIEDKYIEFLTIKINDKKAVSEIANIIGRKNVLLIGPGQSVELNSDKIKEFVENESPYIISINGQNNYENIDAVFISNLKKSMEINFDKSKFEVILTSNLIKNKLQNHKYLYVNYSDLLCSTFGIADNAGLMAINLMQKIGVKKVFLAGFDGYSLNSDCNHQIYDKIKNQKIIEEKNEKIIEGINKYRNNIFIEFITPTLYEKIK